MDKNRYHLSWWEGRDDITINCIVNLFKEGCDTKFSFLMMGNMLI